MTNADIDEGALASSGAYFLDGGEGEVRWMGQTRTRFLATGETTGGLFGLVDETAREGEEIPLHRHDDVESFYVLEGKVSFFVGQDRLDGGPGSFQHIPGGTVHGFRIVSDTARYLIMTTGHHADFYKAISVPSDGDGRPASLEVDWDRVIETAERFGIEMVGELPVS